MITQESIANFNYQALGMDEAARDIQKIIAAINAGGSGLTTGDIVFVDDKEDLPTAVSGVITLAENITYYITNHLDLTGDRLVCLDNTTILGASSENCSITSTGIGTSFPTNYLIESLYTLPIRHITIKDVPLGVGINIS